MTVLAPIPVPVPTVADVAVVFVASHCTCVRCWRCVGVLEVNVLVLTVVVIDVSSDVSLGACCSVEDLVFVEHLLVSVVLPLRAASAAAALVGGLE